MGFIREGCSFNLAKHINQKIISIFHKELEHKAVKLKHMKLGCHAGKDQN